MTEFLTFIEFFCKSFVVGVLITMPIGPVALVVVKKTIDFGKRAGLLAGLGSASADLIYSTAVGFGLGFVTTFFISYQWYLQAAGAIFLIYLGIKSLIQTPQIENGHRPSGILGGMAQTFFLALSNPFTILAIIALLGSLGVAEFNTTLWNNLTVPLGVFCGEFTWMAILVSATDYIERRLGSKIIPILNKVAGVTLLLLAIFILIRITLCHNLPA